jgi:transcriptional regulator with XRE-family HTH domain
VIKALKKNDLLVTNLTQAQLAKKLNVSQVMISKWFSGRHIPRPKTIKKISEATGISEEEFLLFIYEKNKNLGKL